MPGLMGLGWTRVGVRSYHKKELVEQRVSHGGAPELDKARLWSRACAVLVSS